MDTNLLFFVLAFEYEGAGKRATVSSTQQRMLRRQHLDGGDRKRDLSMIGIQAQIVLFGS